MEEVDTDDPFACFDSSDDDTSDIGVSEVATSVGDNQEDQRVRKSQPNEEENVRDPGNGVLAFHAGTEVALLHHVRTELSKKLCPKSNMGDKVGDTSGIAIARAKIQRADCVLDLIDSYCTSRHWMMHIGPEKAKHLQSFIGDCLLEIDGTSGMTILELGTYCGYSSIFFAKTILEHYSSNSETVADDEFVFHIYSVEVVDKFAAVAKELIQLAGMEDYISIILVKDSDLIDNGTIKNDGDRLSLASDLKRNDVPTTIDFLFVDHDKSLYLPNLQELENTKMIRKGTHVAADNVVFAEIDDYRHHMAELAVKGIVTTRLEDSLLVEYCQPELVQMESVPGRKSGEMANNALIKKKEMMRDGIEFTKYLQDPWL